MICILLAPRYEPQFLRTWPFDNFLFLAKNLDAFLDAVENILEHYATAAQ